MSKGVLVVGAGAAGYFAAIKARETNPDGRVVLIEAGAKPLRKVSISGGGRCNVTHACFEPSDLIRGYPRGARELLGPFSRFQPRDTVAWFEQRGVRLKTEVDGRIFPESDLSATIIDCLERAREEAGVELWLKTKLNKIEPTSASSARFQTQLAVNKEKRTEEFDAVVFATGSSPSGYQIAEQLGHEIVPCVPSLFTFEITDARLFELSGVSLPHAEIELNLSGRKGMKQSGPILITHWGLSGPAVIKLSAWAARELAELNYQCEILVNWVPELTFEQILSLIREYKEKHGKRKLSPNPALSFPKRLWGALARHAKISEDDEWGSLRKEQLESLAQELSRGRYSVSGKGEFKEEFVTCGGVSLKEINFRTMESKLVSGIYFAGEILDIDGITGGYNFQSAWTTGWLAGSAIGA